MPDITMCDNAQCPIRNTCYRFMAKPSIYQFYSKFEPEKCMVCSGTGLVNNPIGEDYFCEVCKGGIVCVYFIELSEKRF